MKQQKAYVRQIGLHYRAEIDRMVIDHALITALVERWRPETNTFHFPLDRRTVLVGLASWLPLSPLKIGLEWSFPLEGGRLRWISSSCIIPNSKSPSNASLDTSSSSRTDGKCMSVSSPRSVVGCSQGLVDNFTCSLFKLADKLFSTFGLLNPTAVLRNLQWISA